MRASEFLNEFSPGDGYRGNNDDRPISWEIAKRIFKDFADDSNALHYDELENGETMQTLWGPELGYPWEFISLLASPHGEYNIVGMLLGIHPDKKVDQVKKFVLPMTVNGVDTAVRHYMALRQ